MDENLSSNYETRIRLPGNERMCTKGCVRKDVYERMCTKGCVRKDVYERMCTKGCARNNHPKENINLKRELQIAINFICR